MANLANQHCSTIISIFNDVIKKYENNVEVIKQTEEEINDIMHEVELSSPKDMYKGYLCYKSLKDLRMKRRQAKDENELLKEMYSFLKGQQGQTVKSKLQSIQSSAAKAYEFQQKRVYTPRQRNDLTITNKTCETNKPFEELLRDFNKTKVSMVGGKLRK